MLQYRKWEKGLLRPDGRPGFNTPSGKFEIASSILAEHGYDPLPVYTEPRRGRWQTPICSRNFPWCSTPARAPHSISAASTTGCRGLSEQLPEPPVTMNREDAAELGYRGGGTGLG